MSKSSIISIVLLVFIVLAVGNIFRTCKPEGSTLDVQNFGGLGGYAARQIHEFLGPKKRVVLILFDDSAATIYGKDQYALTEQLKAYEYKILAEETIPAGPLFSNPRATHQGILPLESYQQVASRHPDADAIISFVGPPVVSSETMPSGGRPPLIVANTVAERSTRTLVQNGFVTMAILSRKDAAATPMEMGYGDSAQYANFYEVVTYESIE